MNTTAPMLSPITCSILFPDSWHDDDIRKTVADITKAGYSVSFTIGDTDAPCVDCESLADVWKILEAP